MKPLSDDGRELDQDFSARTRVGGFELYFESGGGNEKQGFRNRDYARALPLLLRRMGALGILLSNIEVASDYVLNVLKLTPAERSLDIPGFRYPIALNSANPESLRLAIARAAVVIGRKPDVRDGGNGRKRLRISADWPSAATITGTDIESLLARPASQFVWTQEPTDDPGILATRVQSARARIAKLLGSTLPPPPPGSSTVDRTTGSVSRFKRAPDVVAWVLINAKGTCEVCEDAAPFRRCDGEPYLEVHHVRFLADGGPDQIDNAVACCPTCHRRLHHGQDREALRTKVLGKLARLVDYPVVELP